MTPIYIRMHAKFKHGDWVKGVGKDVGCSQVFDERTHEGQPTLQPFMYLGNFDPNQFEHATHEEVKEALKSLNMDPNNQFGM